MSTLYLKIMKGTENSDGFDIIPLPAGTAVNFSNDPPQVIAGNVIYPITHTVYLINDNGVTITQFSIKSVDKWKLKPDPNGRASHTSLYDTINPKEINTPEINGEPTYWNPPVEGTISGWEIRDITKLMDNRLTGVRRNGGAMGLGHTRGKIASTFIPEQLLKIPRHVTEQINQMFPDSTDLAISCGKENLHYIRTSKIEGGGVIYGLHLNPESLSPEGVKVPVVELDASDIKPLSEMSSNKPNSFEHLGWVIEDISDSMDPSQTSVALTGGYDSGGNKRSGYTTGAIMSTFIERKMMDVPNEVLDEVFLKYGLHTSVKITHPEVKITYLRLSIQVTTGTAPSVHFAIALDPNNENDAQKIQELLSRCTKFQTLPNGWLAEDIGKEWVSDRVTVDTAGGYVRGSLYAKFITTKELGLPQETLKEIDSVYPDYTTLLISGGGTRSSYLRFISSTADNNRWVQYARLITDNRSKVKVKEEIVSYIRKVTDEEWQGTSFNLLSYSGIIQAGTGSTKETDMVFFNYFYNRPLGSNQMPAILSYKDKYYLAVETHSLSPKIYMISNLDENHQFVVEVDEETHPALPEN